MSSTDAEPDEGAGRDDLPEPHGMVGEPLPPELVARTRALIEAELRSMQPMTWRATGMVMLVSFVVLIAGVTGLSNLSLPILLEMAAMCGAYALFVRAISRG